MHSVESIMDPKHSRRGEMPSPEIGIHSRLRPIRLHDCHRPLLDNLANRNSLEHSNRILGKGSHMLLDESGPDSHNFERSEKCLSAGADRQRLHL